MDARPREILWMRGHGRFYGCAASEVEFRCSGRKILDSPAQPATRGSSSSSSSTVVLRLLLLLTRGTSTAAASVKCALKLGTFL